MAHRRRPLEHTDWPMNTTSMHAIGLTDIPDIVAGDDLAALILKSLMAAGVRPEAGDCLVVAQKIVSKAEGRHQYLSSVKASARALELAAETGKDPRLVELILAESSAVMRVRPGLIIVRHKLGLVMANAGIDKSNIVAPQADDEVVLLLPQNPDFSASQIRRKIIDAFGIPIAVIIADSFGRPWRMGTTNVAIGLAGFAAVEDLRQMPDRYGRKLEVSMVGVADQLAATAGVIMGEADAGIPAVWLSGTKLPEAQGCLEHIIRPIDLDLFT